MSHFKMVVFVSALVQIASAQVKSGAIPRKSESAPATAAAPPETGRFHLLAVKATGRTTAESIQAYDEVFLCDSTTGRVWIYEPMSYLGEKGDPDRVDLAAYFDEVTVDGLHGSHEDALRDSVNFYNNLHTARVEGYCKDHPTGTYGGPPSADCAAFLAARQKQ